MVLHVCERISSEEAAGSQIGPLRGRTAANGKLAIQLPPRAMTAPSRCELNATAFSVGLQRLPAHWLRHFPQRAIGHVQTLQTYRGLKGWGRTLFTIRRGRLLYTPTPPTGCVLRRTPILAWALLELLERHPDLPDVAVPFNCRDKPTYWYPDGPQPQGSYEIGTTATVKDGRPALVFSYTTGHTFSDVPLPDCTFWGLPYARIPPWETWLAERAHAPTSSWDAKIDRILWVGTTGVGNGKLGFSSHPLRARFARCGPATFGEQLHVRGVAKEDIDRLAWKCPPGAPGCFGGAELPAQWLPLTEQCRYRVIVHLPGVSDWLEHFKHQLSCG